MAIKNAGKTDGRALRWVKHRETRMRKFTEDAIGAVRKYGYRISMSRIAEYSHTSKSILYRYFPDKTALQYEVGSRVISELVREIKTKMKDFSLPREKIYAAVNTFLDFIEGDPDLYIFVRIGDLAGEPGNVKLLEFDEILLEMVASAHGRSAADDTEFPGTLVTAHLSAAAMVSAVRSIAETWMFSRRVLERPEEYPDYELSAGDLAVAHLGREEIADFIFTFLNRGLVFIPQ
ncbi:TetR/AcrR family transcriptional regulator [Arcanobacterium sp. S3PF19]|uniref:TetR/AcrR family transcriptional regulator n=1 Tax=Arcanobacterium sp. S3PF19 TaxID=1219585 RepID=UPI0006893483|nr:TetR/AcrR family transcriptional regulator [Arcanobacterium sp. S3PF19]